MIKRNGDNVFAIAASNVSGCQGDRGSGGAAAGVSASRIPQPRARMPDQHTSKEQNIALSTYVEKWKNRYEDAERKHKACLLKSEKARREQDDLNRRFNIITEERNHLQTELRERERELGKLRQVSERLFQEYQQLKQQHEVDAEVMQKVMQQAGEWYKQNKQLKRRSTALYNALPTKPVDIDITDSLETGSDTSTNEEVEFLKKTVKELSSQLAETQAELARAKLLEFEALEHNANLTEELETTKTQCTSQERQLEQLQTQLARHERVSRLLTDQLATLSDQVETERGEAQTYKSEARAAKKRITVLTHQSALLLQDLEMDERLLGLMQEVERLRDSLEQQQHDHQHQLQQLQLKLTEKHEDIDILLWEEKIRLAEEEAREAKERAERAEKRLKEGANKPSPPPKKSALMSRISYFEGGVEKTKGGEEKPTGGEEKREERTELPEVCEEVEEPVAPQPPPQAPLPAPPPPPPPPPVFSPPPPPPPPPPVSAVVLNGGGSMAAMLAGKQGTLRKCEGERSNGGLDAIVNQIKGGKFHLKATEKTQEKKKDDQPEAVKEMLAILGTLRRRRPHAGDVAE